MPEQSGREPARDEQPRGPWYFTFGVGQANAGRYVRITDATYQEARAQMLERFGRQWAFQYDERDWWSDGVSQADKYNLEELIP